MNLADSRLRRAAFSPMAIYWWVAGAVVWPFVQLRQRLRSLRRKGQRSGSVQAPIDPIDYLASERILYQPGAHVILTGPGLGEYVMYKRIAAALMKARPGTKLSYAMRDGNAVAVVRALEPDMNVSYMPVDGYRSALRWLESQRPDAIVFIENYRYPNLIAAGRGFGAQLFLVNGRRRWRSSFKNPFVAWQHRWMFRQFTALGMQQEGYTDTVRRLAPKADVRTTGDIKTDVRVAPLSPERETSLGAWLATDLPLIAAGSTDNPEEERMVVEAFLQTRKVSPCRLLIAPRRSVGIEDLFRMLEENGIAYKTRSQTSAEAEVFVLDTQGELATAYRSSIAVYVGGSFYPKGGGHNVMEPLAWGLPVAFGPYPGNFKAIQELVESEGVGTRVATSAELTAFFLHFLESAPARTQVRSVAERLVEDNKGAVDETVRMLAEHLPGT